MKPEPIDGHEFVSFAERRRYERLRRPPMEMDKLLVSTGENPAICPPLWG